MAYFLKGKSKKTYLYKKKKETENHTKSIGNSTGNYSRNYSRNYVKTIAITTLKSGTGSTYLAKGLSWYLNCVGIIATQEDEEYMLGLEEKIRVYDLGNYYELDEWQEKEFQKADIRLVIVTYNMEEIPNLMGFAQEFDDTCIYLFNFVPDEAQKDVYDMMEDYQAYCLPLFLWDKLNKKIRKIFKEIVK